MKKLLSFLVCTVLVTGIFMSPSCKKIYHSTEFTPTNFRLLGFTKVITRNIIAPPAAWPVITETYSFAYDDNNRVSQILFSTNDSNQKPLGLLDLRMTFDYQGSTVYKTITNLKSVRVVERDTFNLNGYSQLLSAYFPWDYHTFTYQGKLVAAQTDAYRDSGTIVSATSYFTSDNHDLLHQLFNGTLSVTFPDSGIRPFVTPVDTFRDTILSLPLSITWTTFVPGPLGITTVDANHTNNSYSDALSGNSQYMVEVNAVDPYGIYVRPVFFPAGLNSTKFFQIYDYLLNRPGDYLQLEAFKTYGVNVYQNEHLLKQLTTAYDTTFVSYDIDAQSKITQTHVLVKDKLGNATRYEYRLTYDTN